MSGTYTLVMGDRGRLVIPAELRSQAGLAEGTPVVLFDTPGGLVLVTREQLKSRVRTELEGRDLVAELLSDRRAAAAEEDRS